MTCRMAEWSPVSLRARWARGSFRLAMPSECVGHSLGNWQFTARPHHGLTSLAAHRPAKPQAQPWLARAARLSCAVHSRSERGALTEADGAERLLEQATGGWNASLGTRPAENQLC